MLACREIKSYGGVCQLKAKGHQNKEICYVDAPWDNWSFLEKVLKERWLQQHENANDTNDKGLLIQRLPIDMLSFIKSETIPHLSKELTPCYPVKYTSKTPSRCYNNISVKVSVNLHREEVEVVRIPGRHIWTAEWTEKATLKLSTRRNVADFTSFNEKLLKSFLNLTSVVCV